MLVVIPVYLLAGALVALYVAKRRSQPREKEVGDWMMLMSGNPLIVMLGLILWPLWLLFMCFPQESFVEQKSPSAHPAPDHIGRFAEVIIPLTPVGRVSIDGVHRDARAESGTIAEGRRVLICARSIGDEFIVREVIQSPQTKPPAPLITSVERSCLDKE